MLSIEYEVGIWVGLEAVFVKHFTSTLSVIVITDLEHIRFFTKAYFHLGWDLSQGLLISAKMWWLFYFHFLLIFLVILVCCFEAYLLRPAINVIWSSLEDVLFCQEIDTLIPVLASFVVYLNSIRATHDFWNQQVWKIRKFRKVWFIFEWELLFNFGN